MITEQQGNELMEIVRSFDNLPASMCRETFDTLEKKLMELPQLADEDYLLEEYYSGGLYCRKILVPEGAMITGRIYKFDHIEIMLSGEIMILSADGKKKMYHGHNVIEAKSGKRQAGVAIKDTIWITVNQVPENIPMSEMLDYTSVLTYEEYDDFYRDLNRLDYCQFLNELGVSKEQMDELVKADDAVEMEGFDSICTKKSSLDGIGVFTKSDINENEMICPARIGDKRTIAGRYVNHALYPNSIPCEHKGEFYFMAIKKINAGEEITANYRHVINFRLMNGDIKCQAG